MTQSRPKIAVICAHLPERNTGMMTVDLAAHVILNKYFSDADVTLYSFSRGEENPYETEEVAHGYVNILENGERFLSSDVFLFWGDFIQSQSYWEYDMNLWDHNLQKAGEQERAQRLKTLMENRSKYIFLSALSEEKLKRAVVFGSTIITNNASVVNDPEYQRDFKRFFSGAGAVMLRDALSAAKVSPLRDDEATLACDCAFLLDNQSFSELPGFKMAEMRDGVGVFLGRSPSKIRMLLLATLIAKLLGVGHSWLPWFPSSKKLSSAAKLIGYDVATTAANPGAVLSQMSAYKYIVTDTYHVCVNAWRMGIPAVCIGRGADGAVNSLADKKKEILYEMYGGRQLYVFLENMRHPLSMWREAKRVASLLRQENFTAEVAQSVQDHRAMALKRLLSGLQSAIQRWEKSKQ